LPFKLKVSPHNRWKKPVEKHVLGLRITHRTEHSKVKRYSRKYFLPVKILVTPAMVFLR
jgi:hypothetical protein